MEQSMMQRDPREVVEVYRPNEPQEVVEVYTRPLPRAMIPKPLTPTQKRKKKRGKAVILFAVFMVTAAVSAALAETLGTSVNGIRITSVKRVAGSAAPAALQPSLIAGISAALAEALGTSVNGIRITSIKQISL